MYNKVSPNDPFKFPAKLYNDLVDAVRDNEKNKGFKSKANIHSSQYFITNKTGKKLPIYSVLMITDLMIDFPDSADETENLNFFIGTAIVFKGEIPDKDSIHFNKIAIIQQPLADGETGLCVIDGLSKCNIYLKETSNYSTNLPAFLSPVDDNTDYLSLENFGTIECLFTQIPKKQETVFGVANLGGAVVPSFFLVDLVWQSGGDSDTSYEPRIYDIKLNGVLIQAGVDVASGDNPYRRPQDYNVTKADIGLAFVSGKSEVLIAWCNEYPLLGTPEVMP